MRTDVYQIVTDKIIQRVKKEVLPCTTRFYGPRNALRGAGQMEGIDVRIPTAGTERETTANQKAELTIAKIPNRPRIERQKQSKHIENLYVNLPQNTTLLFPPTSTGFDPYGNPEGNTAENSGKQNP